MARAHRLTLVATERAEQSERRAFGQAANTARYAAGRRIVALDHQLDKTLASAAKNQSRESTAAATRRATLDWCVGRLHETRAVAGCAVHVSALVARTQRHANVNVLAQRMNKL